MSITQQFDAAWTSRLKEDLVRQDLLKLLVAIVKTPRKPVEAPVETPIETLVETLAKTPEKILAALKARPDLTLAELASSIGKSLSAVERATARLVKEEKLRFVGPSRTLTPLVIFWAFTGL